MLFQRVSIKMNSWNVSVYKISNITPMGKYMLNQWSVLTYLCETSKALWDERKRENRRWNRPKAKVKIKRCKTRFIDHSLLFTGCARWIIINFKPFHLKYFNTILVTNYNHEKWIGTQSLKGKIYKLKIFFTF